MSLATSAAAETTAVPSAGGRGDVRLVTTPGGVGGQHSVIDLGDRDGIAVLQLTGDYSAYLPDGSANLGPRIAIANEFYASRPDAYDFFVAFTSFEFDTTGADGEALDAFYTGVRNDVLGIGQPLFDAGQEFGSAGKLQGFIDMSSLEGWSFDPLHASYERVLRTLAHEVMHRWGVYVDFRPPGGVSDALRGRSGSHWSFLFDSGGGTLLYGNDWTDQGPGRFRTGPLRDAYNPLDLYLAGFLEADEVPNFRLLVAPEIDADRLPQPGVSIDADVIPFSVVDIVAVEGERVPAASDSQREFRFATIVLTRSGDEVTDENVADLLRFQADFEERFSALTGGRALAHLAPSSLGEGEPGETDVLDGGILRDTPAVVDDALAWLRSRQAGDGSWSDLSRTTLRDTAVVASTLHVVDPLFTGEAAATSWLRSSSWSTTDDGARRIAALRRLDAAASPAPEEIAELASRQGALGGWGISHGHGGTPLDTALSLTALFDLLSPDDRDAAIAWLLAVQNPDGSWGATERGEGSSLATVQTLAALSEASAANPTIGMAATSAWQWLAASQNADGGFGGDGGASSAHETALVLAALLRAAQTSLIDLPAAATFLRDRQSLDGGFEGSVYTTALVADALRRLVLPNLAFASPPTATPNPAYDGEAVVVSAIVVNDGGAPSAQVQLVLSSPSGTEDQIEVPALQPGFQATLELVFDTSGRAGDIALGLEIDPDRTIEELGTGDNAHQLVVEVIAPTEAADLEIRSSELVASPSSTANLPTQVTVLGVVRNNGLQPAADVVVQLREGAQDGALLGELVLPNLPGRSSLPVDFGYQLTAPGTTTLVLIADPEDLLDEPSESNNAASVEIATTPNLDVATTDQDITVDGDPFLGSTLHLDLAVRNRGTLPASNVVVRLLLDDSVDPVVLLESTLQLEPGEERSLTTDWTVDRIGELELRWVVDPDDLLPEGDESNNLATLSLTTSVATQFDLAVSAGDLLASPLPAVEGAPLQLDVTVRNVGGVDAPEFEVAFHDGLPGSGTLLGSASGPALAPSASATVTLVVPALAGAHDRVLIAQVDPADALAELDESNNLTFLDLPVLGLPDLLLGPAGLRLSPRFPAEGNPVDLEVVVANLGEQAVASSVAVYSGDGHQGAATPLAQSSIALDAGASTTLHLQWTWVGSDSLLTVVADPLDQVAEASEANNHAALTVGIDTGDSFAAPFVFSPNGDGVLEETTFVLRLDQPATAILRIVDDLGLEVLRREPAPYGASSEFPWDGRDDLGHLVPDGEYELQLVESTSSSLLTSALVWVDTNRAPLLDAIGTPFESTIDLTCEATLESSLRLTDDERHVFFFGDRPPLVDTLHRRSLADGSTSALLAGEATATFQISPDGRHVVARRRGSSVLTYLRSDGSARTDLPGTEGMTPIGFAPGASEPLAVSFETLYRLPIDGVSPPEAIHTASARLRPLHEDFPGSGSHRRSFSEDGGHLLLRVGTSSPPQQVLLLALQSGEITQLSSGDSGAAEFAPDGRLLSAGAAQTFELRSASAPGAPSTTQVPLPPPPEYLQVNSPFLPGNVPYLGQVHRRSVEDVRWSASGREVLVVATYGLDLPEPDCTEVPWRWYWLLEPSSASWTPLVAETPQANCFAFRQAQMHGSSLQAPSEEYLPYATQAAHWIPGARHLLFVPASSHDAPLALDLALLDADPDTAVARHLVALDSWTGPRDFQVTRSGRRLLFVSEPDPEAECLDAGAVGRMLRSLENLTAEVRAVQRPGGGFELEGTAADRHFDRWSLEFRTLGATSWSPLGPPQPHSTIDAWLTTWAPPGPGTYELRLLAEDRAGNSARGQTRVSAGATPSLADLEISSRLVSPNGDGVLDTVSLSYRVLAPQQLVIQIRDANDTVVRSVTRDHPLAPSPQQFSWDGRNDLGSVVADGHYSFTLQHYRLFFEVDRTPPTIDLAFRDGPQPGETLLDVQVVDEHLQAGAIGSIERGSGASPALFEPFAPMTYDGPVSSGARETLELAVHLEHAEATNGNFRVTVSDAAGNRRVAVSGLRPEVLRLIAGVAPDGGGFELPLGALHGRLPGDAGCPAQLAGGDWIQACGLALDAQQTELRLRVEEILHTPPSQAFVQLREFDPLLPPADQLAWSEAALTEFLPPGGGAPLPLPPAGLFDIVVDLSQIDRTVPHVLRLRLVSADGSQRHTRTLRLVDDGRPRLDFHGRLEQRLASLEATLSAAGLDPELDDILWATTTLDAVSSAALFVASADDPRYLTERRFDAAALGDFPAPAGSTRTALLFEVPVRSCATYSVRMVVFGEPTTIDGTYQLAEPCLELDLQPRLVDLPGCDEPNPWSDVQPVVLRPTSVDGRPLQLLTLEIASGTGPGEIEASYNAPASGEAIELDLDLSGRPEGLYRVRARLHNVDDETILRELSIAVDRTPPEIDITFPGSGELICRSAQVEGRISDDRDFAVRTALDPALPLAAALRYPLAPEVDAGRSPRVLTGALGAPIGGVSGPVDFRITAYDPGGNRTCAERSFFVDGLVDGPTLNVAGAAIPSLDGLAPVPGFSPNGDGVFDAVQIQVAAAENTHATVTVCAAQGCSSTIRTLASDIALLGAGSFSWNGLTDAGVVAADGLYTVRAHLRDDCGNTATLERRVVLDTQAPALAITHPTEVDPLPGIVEVLGTAVERHPLARRDSWQQLLLEWGVGTSPATFVPIRLYQGDAHLLAMPPQPKVLGIWPVAELSGQHTLRLVGVDRLGNRSEVTTVVDIDAIEVLLTGLEAIPPLFSPNADGRRDAVTLRLDVEQPSLLDLEIVDAADAIRRTLRSASLVQPGTHSVLWDGLSDTGQPLADGIYRARARLRLQSAPAVEQEEEISLTLDATPPRVEVLRPSSSGAAAPSVGVVGTIDDEHLGSYEIDVRPAGGSWTRIASGQLPIVDGVLAELAGIGEGSHELRIVARDLAESETELLRSFVLDETPPEVTIVSPADGSSPAPETSNLAIEIEIVEDHLESWTLEVGEGDSPTTWQLVAEGSTPPVSPLTWSVAALPEGRHTLRLSAADLAGLQASTTAAVLIDRTAPAVALDAPTPDSFVAPGDAVVGTVADASLLEWTLEVTAAPPVASSHWQLLAGGLEPVDAALLYSWSALPPDGDHVLRLTGRDAAGSRTSAAVPIRVDTTPPAAPTSLQAQVESDDVTLTWAASPSEDVVGYRVYRDGVDLFPGPPQSGLSALDPGLPEGTYEYHVTAVDHAGLESSPTAPRRVEVDVTPPTLVLTSPTEGARLRGVVELMGSVLAEDLAEYRIVVQEPGGATTLVLTSPIPVQSDVLGSWDASALLGEQTVQLELAAEDTSGNGSQIQRSVVIDHVAPPTPTGLVAVVDVSTVELAWQPVVAADLLGYLISRDGSWIAPSGSSGSDPRELAIAEAEHDDERPDGIYAYRVQAIDLAGNLSPPSAPVLATVETGAPSAVVTVPEDGAEVEGPVLYLLATSDDRDVETVAFEQRPEGGGAFSPIAAAGAEPWEVHWDVSSLALGAYEVRAVATDTSGQTDPAPAVIALTLADLTPPEAVGDVVVTVSGDAVTLSWSESAAPDLAGYHVERAGADTGFARITTQPLAAPTHVDDALADGAYRYRVVAVDDTGNEATASPEAHATVFSPELDQPLTPTWIDDAPTFQGRATLPDGAVTPPLPLEVEARWTSSAGTTALPPSDTDGLGAFTVEAPTLLSGVNTLDVTLVGDDHESKAASRSVTFAPRPQVPTGLAAQAVGLDVELSWNANPEPDVIGYRLLRDGDAVDPDLAAAPSATSASSEELPGLTSSDFAVDGDSDTHWAPAEEARPWIELDFGAPILLSRVELDWHQEELDDGSGGVVVETYAPRHLQLLAWDGAVWVPLDRIEDASGASHELVAPYHYRTSRVRVEVAEPLLPFSYRPLRLAEARAFAIPTDPATARTLTDVGDGHHDFSVLAVNAFGFASDPASFGTLSVGDTTPPSPVALTAQLLPPDRADLAWSQPPEPDVARYAIYRDGQLVHQIDDAATLQWTDGPLPNATYEYEVTAIDVVGNESDPSNPEAVTVAVTPPAPPTLSVTGVTASSIRLAWTPATSPPSPPAASYRLSRATVSGGPYEAVAQTTEIVYDDGDLPTGVAQFYVVEALDAAGNASALSNQVSATPEDLEAPPAPRILHPATPEEPFETRQLAVAISGVAEPGSRVALHRGERLVGEVTASAATSTLHGPAGIEDRAIPASDGQRVLLLSDGQLSLYSHATGITSPLASQVRAAAWLDAQEIALVTWTGELRLARADGSVQLLATAIDLYDVLAGRLPSELLVAARRDVDGLWSFDRSDGSWTLLAELSSGYERHTAALSPDGSVLVYRDVSSLLLLDLSGSLPTTPEAMASNVPVDRPAFSPDGSELAFTGADGGGGSGIQLVDLASRQISVLPGSSGAWSPRYGADPDRIALVRPSELGQEVAVVDRGSGETAALLYAGEELTDLSWTRASPLSLLDAETLVRLTPAGSFRFASVGLEAGDNQFRARSRDAAGNLGESSEPVVVRLLTDELPNLQIAAQGLVAIPNPARTHDRVRLAVTVRNAGPGPSPATPLQVHVEDHLGNVVSLAQSAAATLPSLAAGESHLWTGEVTLDAPGEHQLVAVADPADAVVEVDENDNRAVLAIAVLEPGAIELEVATDRPAYGPDDPVHVTTRVSNPGTATTGSIAVEVTDQDGFLVAELLAPEPLQLAFGDSVLRALTFDAGLVLADTYLVKATWRPDDAGPPRQAQAAFSVGSVFQVDARLGIAPRVALVGSQVGFSVDVDYLDGNALLGDFEVAVTLRDASGAQLAELVDSGEGLLPGASSRHELDWDSSGAAAGQVLVDARVTTPQGLLASDTGLFELVLAPPVVSGSILGPASGEVGVPVLGSVEIGNQGGSAAVGLTGRLQLRSRDLQEVLAAGELVVDVAAGALTTVEIELATAPLPPGDYRLVLEVDESPASAGPLVLDVAALALLDLQPPLVAILEPADSSFFAAQGTLRVRASDSWSAISSVEYQIDDGPWQRIASLALAGVFSQPLQLVDGPHVARARASDAAGNLGEVAESSFVVDGQAPTIEVSGVVDGEIASAPLTPVVTVFDQHLATASILLDGSPFLSGSEVSAPGAHRLDVVAVDLAGNRATLTLSFFLTFDHALTGSVVPRSDPVDVGEPLVADYAISNSESQGLTQMPLRVVVQSVGGGDLATHTEVLDLPGQATVTGEASFEGLAVGEYRLRLETDVPAPAVGTATLVLATSLASVADRTPPELSILAPTDGSLSQPALVLLVAATDQHSTVQRVEARVDAGAWQPMSPLGAGQYDLALSGLVDGARQLVVRAEDAAGNLSPEITATVVVDGTPPAISFGGFVDGQVGEGPVTPTVEISDPHLDPDSVVITLDGQPFVPGVAVHQIGVHEIAATALDLLGNHAERIASFEIVEGQTLFVTLTAPVDGAALDERSVAGAGAAPPLETVVLEVTSANGTLSSTVPADDSGAFLAADVPLAYGVNTIVARLQADPTISDQASVTRLSPDLVFELTVAVDDPPGDSRSPALPGDTLRYDVRLDNVGEGSAWTLEASLPLPEHTTLVGIEDPRAGAAAQGDDAVTWTLDRLSPLQSEGFAFWLRIASPLPPGVDQISLQGQLVADELPALFSDDPGTPEPDDPTVIEVRGLLEIPTLRGALLGLLAALLAGAGLWLLRRDA